MQSPFHEAKASNPHDVSEFQPLNVIDFEAGKSSSGYSSRSSSSNSKSKAFKRSRTNSPNRGDHESNDLSDGASSRQRRKSNSQSGEFSTTESKRRDSIKCGLEELQRVLPQFGSPEEEKISQATVLCEAAKYLKSLKQGKSETSSSLEQISHEIEEMNREIE